MTWQFVHACGFVVRYEYPFAYTKVYMPSPITKPTSTPSARVGTIDFENIQNVAAGTQRLSPAPQNGTTSSNITFGAVLCHWGPFDSASRRRHPRQSYRPCDKFGFVDIVLNEIEARVLGSLIEKEITTPDYYPLSLNALVNACNQKSNREPVMTLDEAAVREALHGLELHGLAGQGGGFESRVAKFEHRLGEVLNLTRGDTAILCELLLRGPQTPGELRGRTERLYQFAELSDVQTTLERMAHREPPLVTVLPRQPGRKEARYIHLMSGEPDLAATASAAAMPKSIDTRTDRHPGNDERIGRIEAELDVLRNEIAALKQEIADFRKQFE